jgi:hypothetical protein
VKIPNDKRRLTLWIACLAILLASLLAPLSQLSISRDAAGLQTEICTTAGLQLVDLPGPGQTDPHHDALMHLSHCPCCFMHLPAFGPAPALMLTAAPAAQSALRLPIPLLVSIPFAPPRPAAYPRAPPHFS